MSSVTSRLNPSPRRVEHAECAHHSTEDDHEPEPFESHELSANETRHFGPGAVTPERRGRDAREIYRHERDHIGQRHQHDRCNHRPRISSLWPLDFLCDRRGVIPAHVVPHRHQHAAEQAQSRGGRRGMSFRQRPHFERCHQHDQSERRRQQKEQPQRRDSHRANPSKIQRRARRDHKKSGVDSMMPNAKPRRHLLQVKDKQRRVDRHVKDARGQREPRFLKSPEVPQTAAHPRVISAFLR